MQHQWLESRRVLPIPYFLDATDETYFSRGMRDVALVIAPEPPPNPLQQYGRGVEEKE